MGGQHTHQRPDGSRPAARLAPPHRHEYGCWRGLLASTALEGASCEAASELESGGCGVGTRQRASSHATGTGVKEMHIGRGKAQAEPVRRAQLPGSRFVGGSGPIHFPGHGGAERELRQPSHTTGPPGGGLRSADFGMTAMRTLAGYVITPSGVCVPMDER
jgi:hypothetical protein